ncbi:MAG: RES family NAD+ phosphorylase [Pseudomonadota bacterium]
MSTAIADAAEPPRPSRADLRSYAGTLWRIFEAQHRISTVRLTDNAADQMRLEMLVEDVKPDLPPAARGLHFLLAAPFRYWHAKPTRFRRGGIRPGIFYASEREETALAETAYWRLRFFAAAPGMALPKTTSEHSAFTVDVRAARALDLTVPPLDAGKAAWMDPDDYTACQTLGDRARTLETQLVRYRSVRDAVGDANAAVMDPAVFAGPPHVRTTWHLRLEAGGLTAQAAFPSARRFVFRAEA